MNENSEHEGIRAAIAAGQKIGEQQLSGTVYEFGEGARKTAPFVVQRTGVEVKSVEHLLAAPLMVRSTVRLDDAHSFVGYVNRFKDADSVVFADLAGRKFEAVLDYHGAAASETKARWGKHRAQFACNTTDEWNAWFNQSGKPMGQVEFARFIEEHIPSIARPEGAALLELCLTLEAKKDVAFRSSTRLQDGQHQFKYEETITAKAGTGGGTEMGQLAVPDLFLLGLEPFLGAGLKPVEARFRYRLNQGELKLWFELVRPNDVLKAAFDEIVTKVSEGVKETPVLSGAAPEIK